MLNIEVQNDRIYRAKHLILAGLSGYKYSYVDNYNSCLKLRKNRQCFYLYLKIYGIDIHIGVDGPKVPDLRELKSLMASAMKSFNYKGEQKS